MIQRWLVLFARQHLHAICNKLMTVADASDKQDEALAAETQNATLLKIDVDECPAVAKSHRVSSLPTFLALRGGAVVGPGRALN